MDPLAQLKDINLPEQISSYPLAPGWWLLAILILSLIIVSIIKLRKYLLIRKDKKTAIAQLQNVMKHSSTKTIDECNAEIIAIIKWASLKYFPRGEVASLYGENFQLFLLNVLPEKHKIAFENFSKDIFSDIYQKHLHDEKHTKENPLQKAALHWLTFALPPKAISLTTTSLSNSAEEKTLAKYQNNETQTPNTANSQASKQAGDPA